MRDFIEMIVVIGGAMAIIFFAVCVPVYIADRVDCSGFQEATGIETQYSGLKCYAKVDGKFVPKEYVFGNAIEARVKN